MDEYRVYISNYFISYDDLLVDFQLKTWPCESNFRLTNEDLENSTCSEMGPIVKNKWDSKDKQCVRDEKSVRREIYAVVERYYASECATLEDCRSLFLDITRMVSPLSSHFSTPVKPYPTFRCAALILLLFLIWKTLRRTTKFSKRSHLIAATASLRKYNFKC